LACRPGQARPGQAAGQVFDFQPGLQALCVSSGQAAGQARLKKNGLLAALVGIIFEVK
jgi:hypothetical protein